MIAPLEVKERRRRGSERTRLFLMSPQGEEKLSSVFPDDSGPWRDRLNRPLVDLRVSVTDRCNFRCDYCMPREKTDAKSFLPRSHILGFEEIARLAKVFVHGGVKKIRLTGGEPLLRKELATLVKMLALLPVEIALTTNGVLLPRCAQELRDAGLQRLTVSLDALDDNIFQRACDAPAFSPKNVLDGIEAAEKAGFKSININCVVRRGLNESQIVPLARHFSGTPHTVRFIEFMDVGTRNGWEPSLVVSEAEIREQLASIQSLRPLPARVSGEVVRRYEFENGGEVGVIASVTQPFCGDCCRARLSADGQLYSCLFAQGGMKIIDLMRGKMADEELENVLRSWWSERVDSYSQERGGILNPEEGKERTRLPVLKSRVEMSYIGG